MNDELEDPTRESALGRRKLIAGVTLGGVAVGAGAVGSLITGSGGSGYRRKHLVVEVACLGELWRESVKALPADDGDFRASFLVEGWIYPEGTIKGDGFIPRAEQSIGRWLCRGYTMIDAIRSEPHATAHQDFIFGSITMDHQFPPVMLCSEGLEGTTDRTQVNYRAVTGGTGEYLGATGQQTEQLVSFNTSLFTDGTGVAPNYRCEFDLLLPN